MSLEVPPAPVYKGARGRPPAKGGEARLGGVLLLPGVGLPPFHVALGEEGGRGGGEEGRGAAAPLSLSYSDWGEGRAAMPWPPLLSTT